MKKSICFFLILFNSLFLIGQDVSNGVSNYPTDYFRNPMELPMLLSGTFAELRSNHFHAGLDIKTRQREGFKVFTAAPGYVSRIKISHWGYGKAIYITHPNGYTTVYAHLKKFSDRIESYIKKQQYQKESFEIQVFPNPSTLKIEANELIAFSGSTGGFVPPHLHFEIRNTKTEKPINPMYFGYKLADSKKPNINLVLGYSLDNLSHINRTAYPTQLILHKLENGDLKASPISAFGKIGFGINAFDQLDGAPNKNGLHKLTLLVDGKKYHEFEASSFSYAETKYINLLIDYPRYDKLSQRIHKCFTVPENPLSMYKTKHNGYLNIEDGSSYTVEIIAADFKGNQQKVIIPINGKKEETITKEKAQASNFKILKDQYHKFDLGMVNVAFPSNTFYQNFYLDFKIKNDSMVTVHNSSVPVNKAYTLTFDVSKYTEKQKKQLHIAFINKKGVPQYVTTHRKENKFYTSTKNLGNFALMYDKNKPSISLKNFKSEQWMTNFKTLQVKISDAESGIKSYRAEIDGAWILMEYNVKTGTLIYDFNDIQYTSAKHELKVEVIDNVGNKNNLSATFYRKK